MERSSRQLFAALVLVLSITDSIVAQSSLEMGPPMAAPNASIAVARDADADTVRSVANGESVGDLMTPAETGPSVASGRPEAPAGAGSTLLRVLAWTVTVLALGGALLMVLKKFTPIARHLNADGMVRILGRTALSPKHSVFVLRVSNQKILIVGVSGERMVNLSELSDPTAILGMDREFNAALDSFGGQWPEREGKDRDREDLYPSRIASHVEPAAVGNGPRVTLPYQREVQKIRDLLGSWRSKFHREGDGTLQDGAPQDDHDVESSSKDLADGVR